MASSTRRGRQETHLGDIVKAGPRARAMRGSWPRGFEPLVTPSPLGSFEAHTNFWQSNCVPRYL
jgi:hypothetical protein